MTLTLTSTAFGDGDAIPTRFSCDGTDVSPPFSWSGAPPGTKSFALLCEDPDAPVGTWHHWAVFDIPPTATGLDEGMPRDPRVGPVRQAINDFRKTGYGGPCPPPGHGVHHYRFRLLALDVESLDLDERAACSDVAEAALPHVLISAEIVGTYSR